MRETALFSALFSRFLGYREGRSGAARERKLKFVSQPVRNLNFLEDYLRNPKLQIDSSALKLMQKLFAAEPVMTLKTLLEHVEAQHIYSALLLKHIYIDLLAAPLADSEYVHVFRDEAMAQTYLILSDSPYQPSEPGTVVVGIGERVVWDGRAWTIFNHGDTVVSMRSDGGDWIEVNREEFHALVSRNRITQPTQKGQARIGGINDEEVTTLARATKQDREEGNARYRILQRYRSGETPEQLGTPYRTLRDWEVKYEEAEREYGHGYIGLITHYQRSGNPQRKLPDASLACVLTMTR